VSMWEPFTEPARRMIVRSQEVAQLFSSPMIGTEHMIFALAETDDEVGAALTKAIDSDALRSKLGAASNPPSHEMVFTSGAKQSIELAFEAARKLKQGFVAPPHLAIGILGSADPPPLLATIDAATLRVALEFAAEHVPARSEPGPEATTPVPWEQTAGDSSHPEMETLFRSLPAYRALDVAGTRVTLTITVPGQEARTWTWVREETAPS
jgi:ATP-dependent Clp protease ATP-binding subunit ClpA